MPTLDQLREMRRVHQGIFGTLKNFPDILEEVDEYPENNINSKKEELINPEILKSNEDRGEDSEITE